MRDRRWLVGYGMATAIRVHLQGPAKVRVRLGPDGIAVVQTDMTDIGTGTYTILTQVAADALDLPPKGVRVELGRSDLPASWGSGGSWGASNSSVALHLACTSLREELRNAGGRIPEEGLEAEDASVALWEDPNYGAYSIHTYGAQFAEVGVDADTGEILLRRMLGVFAPGRVLNGLVPPSAPGRRRGARSERKDTLAGPPDRRPLGGVLPARLSWTEGKSHPPGRR
jgi:xanthine dehydrogenase YagR molybdenum-binding subunit